MQELYWKNAANLPIYAIHWACQQPKAVIALIHGQGEHIGRYHHVARFFNDHQVAVWGYDQQGFGKSGGKKGHAANLDAYLDDIGLLIDKISETYPNLPIWLYAHSMGGNVALNYVFRRSDPRIKKLIATGPWIQLAFSAPAAKIWAGKLLKSIFPALTLPSGLDTNMISRDAKVVAAYNNDPLVHDKVSAAAGIALLKGANWLHRYSGPTPCPILLMHGGSDMITSARATKALAGRLTGEVIYKEWEGLFHEIHNEPEQNTVFEFTANVLGIKNA